MRSVCYIKANSVCHVEACSDAGPLYSKHRLVFSLLVFQSIPFLCEIFPYYCIPFNPLYSLFSARCGITSPPCQYTNYAGTPIPFFRYIFNLRPVFIYLCDGEQSLFRHYTFGDATYGVAGNLSNALGCIARFVTYIFYHLCSFGHL